MAVNRFHRPFVVVGGTAVAVGAAGAGARVGPDLVDRPGKPPAASSPGASFRAIDTALNRGRRSAKGTTTRYYLSLDRKKGRGDVRVGSRRIPLMVEMEDRAACGGLLEDDREVAEEIRSPKQRRGVLSELWLQPNPWPPRLRTIRQEGDNPHVEHLGGRPSREARPASASRASRCGV